MALRHLALALLTVLNAALGCTQSAATSHAARQPKPSYPPPLVHIAVSSERTDYLPAQRVIIRTTIRNEETNAVLITVMKALEEYELTVTRDGLPVPFTLWGKSAMQSRGEETRVFTQKLEPNEESSQLFLINRIFDMTDSGEYHVKAARWVKTADARDVEITSNELVIRVADEAGP